MFLLSCLPILLALTLTLAAENPNSKDNGGSLAGHSNIYNANNCPKLARRTFQNLYAEFRKGNSPLSLCLFRAIATFQIARAQEDASALPEIAPNAKHNIVCEHGLIFGTGEILNSRAALIDLGGGLTIQVDIDASEERAVNRWKLPKDDNTRSIDYLMSIANLFVSYHIVLTAPPNQS